MSLTVRSAVEADLTAVETPMEPELAEAIYELDRCIECGCCIAGCGTAQMREGFVGAVGLPRFQDAIAPVIDQARALDQPEVAEIAAALGDLARWLRQDPLRLTDALCCRIGDRGDPRAGQRADLERWLHDGAGVPGADEVRGPRLHHRPGWQH